jgi:hypothetical protein
VTRHQQRIFDFICGTVIVAALAVAVVLVFLAIGS